MARLAAASDAAREGSIEALRQQQQRLIAIEEPPLRALLPPKPASTAIEVDSFFCPYSLDLQFMPKKPLAVSFALGGDCRCPDCGRRVDVIADDFWKIGKRTPIFIKEGAYEKEIMRT